MILLTLPFHFINIVIWFYYWSLLCPSWGPWPTNLLIKKPIDQRTLTNKPISQLTNQTISLLNTDACLLFYKSRASNVIFHLILFKLVQMGMSKRPTRLVTFCREPLQHTIGGQFANHFLILNKLVLKSILFIWIHSSYSQSRKSTYKYSFSLLEDLSKLYNFCIS